MLESHPLDPATVTQIIGIEVMEYFMILSEVQQLSVEIMELPSFGIVVVIPSHGLSDRGLGFGAQMEAPVDPSSQYSRAKGEE